MCCFPRQEGVNLFFKPAQITHLTFPNSLDPPTIAPQFSSIIFVSLHVSSYFCLPIISIFFWYSRPAPTMVPMPETAIYKNDPLTRWKYDIGITGQILTMKFIAVTERTHYPSDC